MQYVFLGATSTFKGDSDLAKYEKARKLKDLIVDIRKNYEKVSGSSKFVCGGGNSSRGTGGAAAAAAARGGERGGREGQQAVSHRN